jgi:hypothetical protein
MSVPQNRPGVVVNRQAAVKYRTPISLAPTVTPFKDEAQTALFKDAVRTAL